VTDRAEWAVDQTPDADPILATETSRRFHRLMDAAMQVSFYKYGHVGDGYPERVDAVKSLKARLDKYAKTGNAEWLVDVANFAMIEFMHPRHAKAHFKATDADGSPGRVAANTDIYDTPVRYKNTDLEPAECGRCGGRGFIGIPNAMRDCPKCTASASAPAGGAGR
jgi:hypothetical protein